jgi:thiol-disulfide isomerase/thioredoxin
MNKKFHEIKSLDVANTIFVGFYSKISGDKAKANDYFKLIEANTKNQNFINAAKKKLEEIPNITKGDVSPSFTYNDIDGNAVSLEDFKGKIVYIDVWATWCGPCLKQIPYLKSLEHHFKGQDIAFVSISVDKKEAFETWKNMVVEKELGGVQLFANNAFQSEFIEAYGIHSIPSFILIDKQGHILDEKAPNPSYDKTLKILEGLLD